MPTHEKNIKFWLSEGLYDDVKFYAKSHKITMSKVLRTACQAIHAVYMAENTDLYKLIEIRDNPPLPEWLPKSEKDMLLRSRKQVALEKMFEEVKNGLILL